MDLFIMFYREKFVDIREYERIFSKAETKYKLYHYNNSKGLNPWYHVRHSFYYAIYDGLCSDENKGVDISDRKSHIITIFSFVLFGVFTLIHKKSRVLFLRKETSNKTDRFIDPVINYFEQKKLRLMTINTIGRKASSYSLLSYWAKLSVNDLNYDDELYRRVCDFVAFIESSANEKSNIPIKKLLDKGLLDFYREIIFYERLFKYAKKIDKMYFISNGPQKGTLYTARQNGISTYELQHGLIKDTHPLYSFPSTSLDKSYFPHKIYTWGAYWNNITNYPVKSETLGVEMAYDLIDDDISNDNMLLVTSDYYQEDFVKLVEEMLSNGFDGNSIFMKLHPNQFSEFEAINSHEVLSKINVLPIDCDFEYCIKNFNCFLIIQSTMVYELLHYGKIIYLYKVKDYQQHQDVISSNLVKCFDGDDINILEFRSERGIKKNTNDYFREYDFSVLD
jgi:hypothetical protein